VEAYLRVCDSVCECVSECVSDCGSERGRAPALLMQWTVFSMDKGVRQQWVGDKGTGLRAGQSAV
jgi:hypothetical protein